LRENIRPLNERSVAQTSKSAVSRIVPSFSLALWSAAVLRRFPNVAMLAPKTKFGINLLIELEKEIVR